MQAREVFDALDKDGDEYITLDELNYGIELVNVVVDGLKPQVAARKLMAQADVDGDGRISWDEFIDAIVYRSATSTYPGVALSTPGRSGRPSFSV